MKKHSCKGEDFNDSSLCTGIEMSPKPFVLLDIIQANENDLFTS